MICRKKIMTAMALVGAVGFATPGKLVGRWESTPVTGGTIAAAVFREDGGFEAYQGKHLFISGTYSFSPKDSVFTLTDNGCNGLAGTYKILFFSNSDSLRLAAIHDNCAERKEQIEGLVMGRAASVAARSLQFY